MLPGRQSTSIPTNLGVVLTRHGHLHGCGLSLMSRVNMGARVGGGRLETANHRFEEDSEHSGVGMSAVHANNNTTEKGCITLKGSFLSSRLTLIITF